MVCKRTSGRWDDRSPNANRRSPWKDLNAISPFYLLQKIALSDIIPSFPESISQSLKMFLEQCFIRSLATAKRITIASFGFSETLEGLNTAFEPFVATVFQNANNDSVLSSRLKSHPGPVNTKVSDHVDENDTPKGNPSLIRNPIESNDYEPNDLQDLRTRVIHPIQNHLHAPLITLTLRHKNFC